MFVDPAPTILEGANTGMLGGIDQYSDVRDSLSRLGIKVVKRGMQSDNFVLGTTGWKLDADGTIYGYNAVFAGGTIGGFSIGADYIRDAANSFGLASTVAVGDDVRFWAGATFANRATAPARITEAGIIYATGAVIDGTTTIGGRLASVLATAIDSAGHFIDATLNTSAKTILDAFTFGASGALQIGTYVNGVSGDIRISPNGIVGRNSAGANTFTIDGTTGNATFAGTLSAVTGTLGTLTIASGGNIKLGQTAYNTGNGFWMGDVSTVTKLSIGDGTSANSLLWDGTDLIIKGYSFNYREIFGDGSDGDVTISAPTTLTRDMVYNNLTVSSTLDTAGYRIFVLGTLTVTNGGSISRNGNDAGNGGVGGSGNGANAHGAGGSGGTAGAALASTSVFGSVVGIQGGNGSSGGGANPSYGGNGDGGTPATNSISPSTTVNDSGAGGDGGVDTGDLIDGGSVGSNGAITLSNSSIKHISLATLLFNASGFLKGSASSGGSGGGSSGFYKLIPTNDYASGGGGGGGGSASPGGLVLISAKIIVVNSGGIISANGGNGGTGGDGGSASGGTNGSYGGGGGGGGAGGNGGIVVLIYKSYTNSGTVSVTKGVAGIGGALGTGTTCNGTAGGTAQTAVDGSIIQIDIS